MIDRLSVKWLQVENTTKCNAWCPGCGRNNGGFGLNKDLVIEDLPTNRLKEVLEYFPNLHAVQFCGTYGDTVAAANVLEHIDVAMSYAEKIQIHTHGGIRNASWWENLGKKLSGFNHNVWFAIDGLKGVHEVYRQGTDFDKVIENASAFISAGGVATWQFIPWEHNESQIQDCLKLSQQIGFKKFIVLKDVKHRRQGYHWKTGEPIEFRPWSRATNTNRAISVPEKKRDAVDITNCRHIQDPSVYLNANGLLSSCCFFNWHRSTERFDQLPNIESELITNPDQRCLTNCGYIKD